MEYFILTNETAIKYALEEPSIAGFLDSIELECSEIGDGNLNQVFLIKTKIEPYRSIILKQALPYLRCVGEAYPLGRDRMRYEIRSLEKFSEVCPEHTPIIYHSDEDMCLVAMQNLDSHVIMRKGITEGVKYPMFAEHISDFLAKTLFFTSSFALESADKRKLEARFLGNAELCKLTEDFVFTLPFMNHETNRHDTLIDEQVKAVRSDGEFKRAVMRLKNRFMNFPEALIHGDLHTGSIMLNEKETFVIDSEFAFFGPIGFDVGAVFGNLLMGYAASKALGRYEYAGWLLETAQHLLELFAIKFKKLLKEQGGGASFGEASFWEEIDMDIFIDEYISGLMQDSAGFAGCKMMRRQMGIAHILEIDSIEDEKVRAEASREVIAMARRLVVGYSRVSRPKDVVKLAVGEMI